MKKLSRGVLLLAIIGCFAGGCFASDWDDEIAGTTEITGYYQQYRNFSFETGYPYWDFKPPSDDPRIDPIVLSGGGVTVAQNLAEWFAVWTQLSFFGRATQQISNYENSVRVIHNLQGIRYQTKQYGPLRFYGKVGAGIAWYGFSLYDPYYGYMDMSGTTFSAGYGGGMNVWFNKNIGITLDVSHSLMALPNLTDLDGREKFDSGMSYTTGLTFRF